jgi:hypothetical protein
MESGSKPLGQFLTGTLPSREEYPRTVPPVLGSHVLLPCPQGKGTQKNKTKLFRRKNNFKPPPGSYPQHSWVNYIMGSDANHLHFDHGKELLLMEAMDKCGRYCYLLTESLYWTI